MSIIDDLKNKNKHKTKNKYQAQFNRLHMLGYSTKQIESISFSNGLIVNVKSGDYAINLGRIVEKGNI